MTHEAETVRRAVAALPAALSSLQVVRKAIRASENPDCSGAHIEQIWRTSVAAGAAAYVIARLCRKGDPEELLTIGLLHNVGEFALLDKFPGEYLAVQRIAGGRLYAEGMRVVFGVGAGEVSQWLLDAWSFPPRFGQAAARWRDAPCPPDSNPLGPELCVIHVAVSVAEAWMEGLDEEEAFARISPHVAAQMPLDPDLLRKLYGQLAPEVEETEAMLQD